MGIVQTNETTFFYAEELTPGVLTTAGSGPTWVALEPNDISTFGANITKIARNPISPDRMAKKGAIADVDSTVEFNADLTISAFNDFAEGFLRSSWETQLSAVPTAATATTNVFAHPALTGAIPANRLVFTRNFSTAINNGVHLVASSGSSTTATKVTTSLTSETPPAGVKLEVCGVQGAAGDITMNSSGYLTSTTLDFTTLGLSVGQKIYIGDGTSGNSFATAGSGHARVKIIAANLLTLEQHASSITVGVDAGATKTIRIFYGDFIRNVSLSSADYVSKTYQFEAGFTNLDTIDDGWRYSKGNSANQLVVNLTPQSKAEVTFSFIGQDVEDFVDTVKAGTHGYNYLTDALSTTADIAQIAIKTTGGVDLTTYLKSFSLTINNNISPEKVLGTLGGVATNIGDFQVTFDTSILFTSKDIVDAVRNNTTLALTFLLNNDDGGLFFDIPSMILDNESLSLPRNESTLIETSGSGFKDDFYEYVISVSRFPYLPI